jgi:hypothetical protein
VSYCCSSRYQDLGQILCQGDLSGRRNTLQFTRVSLFLRHRGTRSQSEDDGDGRIQNKHRNRRGMFVVVVIVSLLATPTMSLWRAHRLQEEQYIPHGIQSSVPSFRSRVTAWKPSRSPWNVNKCLAKSIPCLPRDLLYKTCTPRSRTLDPSHLQ